MFTDSVQVLCINQFRWKTDEKLSDRRLSAVSVVGFKLCIPAILRPYSVSRGGSRLHSSCQILQVWKWRVQCAAARNSPLRQLTPRVSVAGGGFEAGSFGLFVVEREVKGELSTVSNTCHTISWLREGHEAGASVLTPSESGMVPVGA